MSVTHLFDEIMAVLKRIDIVVNCAGKIGSLTPTHEMSERNWLQVIDVNLNGAFFVARAALRHMVTQEPQGGVLLNIASIAAHQGMETLSPYTAAKAAVIGLTRTLAVEYASRNVRVVAVSPTATATPLVEQFLQDAEPATRAAFRYHNPLPGMPKPRDVAYSVLFLCSEEARFVSGSVVPVDGGYLAGSGFPHVRGEIAELLVEATH